ncbi:MAG TPA: hydrogenase maturation protease [Candidatus Limnocylindrales bacterium]|nr:hydrogenase maturation protease [Candidatus Limnocylindrales bacterium]
MTSAGASSGDTPATTRAGSPSGPVLVVGYGNPLRSDDGVGPAVAARLVGDPRLAGADIRSAHQLTPELALDASRASLLVLVDAGVGEAPGEVSMRRLEPSDEAGGAWTHHVDPAGIVGLARELFGAAPPVVMISIGPATLELGESLSRTVADAVTRAADLVATVVEAHRRT